METGEFLFGKIAATLGYLSEDQVRECLQMQKKEGDLPIGQILIREGHLTPDQLEEVLATQRNYMRKVGSTSREKVEDSIFGKLIVGNAYATAAEVEEALRVQREREDQGRIVPLGSILVEQGALTMAQVEEVLKKQWKKILVCNTCQKQFNVFGYEEGKRFLCRTCKSPLEIPQRLKSVKVEREG